MISTNDSILAEDFNVALHFVYAGSSGNSSITVFVNSGCSDPSSSKYFLTHSETHWIKLVLQGGDNESHIQKG